MEVRHSLTQSNQNFGMALIIDKKAEPFIESLSAKERQYIRQLGERIKNSRNHINIGKGGSISLSYEPKASEIRLINESERAAIEAEDKAFEKKLNAEMTFKEKVDNAKYFIKSIFKFIKIKMSLGKSKFMRELQINEDAQKAIDRDDELTDMLKARLETKNLANKEDTQKLMSEFGDK